MPDEIPAGVQDDEREREEKKDERGVASGEWRAAKDERGVASGEGMTNDEGRACTWLLGEEGRGEGRASTPSLKSETEMELKE